MADPKNPENEPISLPLPPIAVKPSPESPNKEHRVRAASGQRKPGKTKIQELLNDFGELPRDEKYKVKATPQQTKSLLSNATPSTLDNKTFKKMFNTIGESPKSSPSTPKTSSNTPVKTPKDSKSKWFKTNRVSPLSTSTPETSPSTPVVAPVITPEKSMFNKWFNKTKESPTSPTSSDKPVSSANTVWEKIEPFINKVDKLSNKIDNLEKEKRDLEIKLQNMETNKTPSNTINTNARNKIENLEKRITNSNSKQQELLSKIDKLQKQDTVSANISKQPTTLLSLPNTQKTKDENKIKEYIKEFQSQAAKLETYKKEIIEAFQNQANNIHQQVKSVNDGAKKKQGLQMILTRAKSAVAQFKTKNLYFLIDKGFRTKADYLLEFDATNYKNEVSKLDTNVLQPFADEVESVLKTTFVVSDDTEDSDDLLEALENFKNELTVTKQKIYDIYNNNISIMDIINTNFLVVYGLKFFRLLFTWFSLYLASKIFQEKYVKKVFANNEDPPDLRAFVGIFLGLEVAFMSAVFIFLVLLKYVFDKGGDFVINAAVLKRFMVDYLISTVFIIVFAILLASIMMKKKYFRYKVDGLRAIRGLQEIVLYIASIISIIPFFLVI